MPAPADGECKLQVGNGCHQPKKNHYCCKYCWENATDDQNELIKGLQPGYCAQKGCFEWRKPSSKYCIEHDHCQVSASSITESTKQHVESIKVKEEGKKKAEAAEAHETRRRGRSAGSSSAAAGSSSTPTSRSPRRAAMLAAAVKELSTPELKVLADNCIKELFERANATF